MGRPRDKYSNNPARERHREVARSHYYRTRDQALRGLASIHATAIIQQLKLDLTPEQSKQLQDYMIENFKFRTLPLVKEDEV